MIYFAHKHLYSFRSCQPSIVSSKILNVSASIPYGSPLSPAVVCRIFQIFAAEVDVVMQQDALIRRIRLRSFR
jgi:hypothetical protein